MIKYILDILVHTSVLDYMWKKYSSIVTPAMRNRFWYD